MFKTERLRSDNLTLINREIYILCFYTCLHVCFFLKRYRKSSLFFFCKQRSILLIFFVLFNSFIHFLKHFTILANGFSKIKHVLHCGSPSIGLLEFFCSLYNIFELGNAIFNAKRASQLFSLLHFAYCRFLNAWQRIVTCRLLIFTVEEKSASFVVFASAPISCFAKKV